MVEKAKTVWADGKLRPWDEARLDVLTHTLHYGLGAFEGIRSYARRGRRAAVFRLQEHVARLFDTCRLATIEMPYTPPRVAEACLEALAAADLGDAYRWRWPKAWISAVPSPPPSCLIPSSATRTRAGGRYTPPRRVNAVRWALLCSFFAFVPITKSSASDFALYECKSDIGSVLRKEIAKDKALAPGAEEAVPHDVYKFDFHNKTVTYRMLNGKGQDYELLGVGQTSKYTVDVKIEGDTISWQHTMAESAEGAMTEHYVFNVKTAKLHGTMVMKPVQGEAQSMDENFTCSKFVVKKRQP